MIKINWTISPETKYSNHIETACVYNKEIAWITLPKRSQRSNSCSIQISLNTLSKRETHFYTKDLNSGKAKVEKL